jgi:hypothetical protein
MNYTTEEREVVVGAIGTMMINFPEIDNRIEILTTSCPSKIKKLKLTNVKRLKECLEDFIDKDKIKKKITIGFLSYCLYQYCGSKQIFDDELIADIERIEDQMNKKEKK